MGLLEQALDAVAYFVAADVAAKEGTGPSPPNDSISQDRDQFLESNHVQAYGAAAESEHANRDTANFFNLQSARFMRAASSDFASPHLVQYAQMPPQLDPQSPGSAVDIEPRETALASVSPAAASPEEPSVELQMEVIGANTLPTPAPCLLARPRSQRRRTQVIRAHFIASDMIGLSFASPLGGLSKMRATGDIKMVTKRNKKRNAIGLQRSKRTRRAPLREGFIPSDQKGISFAHPV